MLFITISGIDKSGKSTIGDAYMKKTNYVNYAIVRDPSNYMALNYIQDRIKDIEQMDQYHMFMENFKYTVDLAVFLICKPSALDKRFILNHEPELVGDLTKEEHQDELLNWFSKAEYPNFIVIDTTNKTVDECVNIIIKQSQE